jgi:tetratricopeptide (TPR) repeat protein
MPAGLSISNRVIADPSLLPNLAKTNAELDSFLLTRSPRETYPKGSVVNAPDPVIVYVLRPLVIGFDKNNKIVYAETYKNPTQNPDKPGLAAGKPPGADAKPPADSAKIGALRGGGITAATPVDNLKGFTEEGITAKTVEAYIRHVSPKSPMLEENGGKPGVGQWFIDAGKERNVNPAILVALAQEESQYGQQGWVTADLKARGSQNPFGYGINDSAYPSLTLKVHLDEKFSPIYQVGADGRKYLVSEEINWQSWFADWKSAVQTTTWQISNLKSGNFTIEKLGREQALETAEPVNPKKMIEIMNDLYAFTADEYLAQANAAQRKGDYKLAASLARRAVALDNNCMEAWTALSKALIQTESENPQAYKEYAECPSGEGEVGDYMMYFSALSLYKRGAVDAKLQDALKSHLKTTTDPKLKALYEKLLKDVDLVLHPPEPERSDVEPEVCE